MEIGQEINDHEYLSSRDNGSCRRNKTFGELRKGIYQDHRKPKEEDLGSLFSGPLIVVRGRDLAERLIAGLYRTSIKKYLERESVGSAARICDYLKYDLKISPETARRIFAYAIEVIRSDPENQNLLEKKVEETFVEPKEKTVKVDGEKPKEKNDYPLQLNLNHALDETTAVVA